MVDVVVGFDAGGTSTQCALMTLDGKVLAHGSAGPGNYQIVRADGVRRALQQSLAAARAAAGHEVRVRAAFLGIAGLTTAQEEQTLAEMCRALDIAPKLQIMGDMVPALAAGTRGEPGIVVIGGTGSICWGLDAAGNTARAGGWGYLFGDEGSGFYIGRRAPGRGLSSLRRAGTRHVAEAARAGGFGLRRPARRSHLHVRFGAAADSHCGPSSPGVHRRGRRR